MWVRCFATIEELRLAYQLAFADIQRRSGCWRTTTIEAPPSATRPRPEERRSEYRQTTVQEPWGATRVEIEDPEESLTEVVPDSDYRSTFLKLTRNLAPDGESCSRLDVQTVGDSLPISLGLDVRQDLGRVIRKTRQGNETPDSQTESLHGLLRAVHLDNDWLELAVDNERVRVIAVSEEVDDVIGPLVNRPVIVRVSLVGGKRKFLDIEPESPRR